MHSVLFRAQRSESAEHAEPGFASFGGGAFFHGASCTSPSHNGLWWGGAGDGSAERRCSHIPGPLTISATPQAQQD